MGCAEPFGMAHRGTTIAFALCLVVACEDSRKFPVVTSFCLVSGVHAAPLHCAGEGGGGAGGSGGGGVGGVGGGAGPEAGTGGDAGGNACMSAEPPAVYACVLGDSIPFPGTGPIHVDFTGTVERAAADALACMAQAGSRTVGNSSGAGQAYVIRDGDAELQVTLRTGSERPLLVVGERVRVTIDDMPTSALFSNDSIALGVRDAANDTLLYWFAYTQRGLEELALPQGLSGSSTEPACTVPTDCGVNTRRGLALLDGSEEVALGIGELASVGGLSALLLDNSEFEPTERCFDSVAHHTVSLALFAPERVSKCDWLGDSACSTTERCHAVFAYLRAPFDPSAMFVACVAEGSCDGGAAATCAINDETELPVQFTTTCVPPGWTRADGACDPDLDGGT